MKNDGKYFVRVEGNVLVYPDDIFPINHHNIKLFASQDGDEWSVTEQKTGYRIGNKCPTMEEAIKSAEDTIGQKGINPTKKAIKEACQKCKEGLVYDAESKEWVTP